MAIVGIPYDGATTNRPGSRFGPRAIRDASHMLCDATHPLFNISPTIHISDYGDLMLPNTNLNELRKFLELSAKTLIASQHIVWLGGDHSITLSLLRAYYTKLGNLALT
jgi:agmatinase